MASPIWFACARSLSRDSSVTGRFSGTSPEVLNEQQMPQMLEQLDDKAPDVLALLGQLLDVGERAGGVAVDDEIAEPEERLLVYRPKQLEHGLHGDLAPCRRRQLVERRHRVAEAALRRPRDKCERRVGHVDALAVRDPS